MDPSTQLSLFGAWRHPAMGMGSMAGMGMAGMDITHAAYRYNQNMMEYYTCKSKSLQAYSFLCLSLTGSSALYLK